MSPDQLAFFELVKLAVKIGADGMHALQAWFDTGTPPQDKIDAITQQLNDLKAKGDSLM